MTRALQPGTVNLGAFRCAKDDPWARTTLTAHLERSDHASLQRALDQLVDAGLVHHPDRCRPPCGPPWAALDEHDVTGDHIAEWCIPTREAYEQVATLLELRPDGPIGVPSR